MKRNNKILASRSGLLLILALALSGCSIEDSSQPVTSPDASASAAESSESVTEETEDALAPFALESIEAVETNFGDCVAALSDPGEYTYRAKSSPEGAGTVTFKSETHTLVWDTAPSKTGALLTIPNLATDDLFWDSGCYD